MLRTGVDLIEIERLQSVINRRGHRFLRKVYTQNELDLCDGRVESLAARFAAKEAVGKALRTGLWRHTIGWKDIEVLREAESGAPVLYLHNAAAEQAARQGLHEWSISLSHDRRQAIAFVVAMGSE